MLLLILLLIGAIVFTVITIKFNDDYTLGNFLVQTFSAVAVICCVIGFIIVLSNILYSASIETSGYTAKMEEYRSIEYKLDNLDSYVDEFDINKANVIEEIQEWNKTVKEKQILTHNVFVGGMCPNYWDKIPTFDYDEVYQKINEANKNWGISNVDW